MYIVPLKNENQYVALLDQIPKDSLQHWKHKLNSKR